MCCYTDETTCKYAKEDMIVFKVYIYMYFDCINNKTCFDVLKSPLYGGGSRYFKGKTYDCGKFEVNPTEKNRVLDGLGENEVLYGFHSFKNKKDAEALAEKLNEHIFLYSHNANEKAEVMICEIPKGTEIFEGKCYFGQSMGYAPESYVSRKIKIIATA